MSSKSISEDVLGGVVEVLYKHEPSLLPIITALQGTVESPSWAIGTSVLSQLKANVSYEDGLKVLSVLQRVHDQEGYDSEFNGRTIFYLTSAWRRFIEPRRV